MSTTASMADRDSEDTLSVRSGRSSGHPRSRSPSPGRSPLHALGKNIGQNLGLSARSHHRRTSSSGSMTSNGDEPGGGTSTSIQDRIFARMLQQVLPSDYQIDDYATMKNKRKADRPPFSLTLMSTNFRRFNARIGVVFVFQHRVIRLLQWAEPVHTLAALCIYSFICLDPYLLAVFPLAIVVLFVMVPAFIARHPPPPSGHPIEKYNASGPAIAPPPEVKAVTEMSKDFFRNLRDLQNSMEDFSIFHDNILKYLGPPTNFSEERLSSAVYLVLSAVSITLFIAARLLPWRIVFLLVGWSVFASGHPAIADMLAQAAAEQVEPRIAPAKSYAETLIKQDISLSTTAETREVEIFELQRRTSAGEYEPWIFAPTPYDPLSPARIADKKPCGTRFFEDVKPPPGWEWGEGKWTLDLGSLVWVQERFVNGVEVEEEGERWVYDYTEGAGRGEWRRRRWVQGVKRRYLKRSEEDEI